MSLATLDDDQVKFDTIGGYILYKLEMFLYLILMNVFSRCLPVHRSWVHAKRLLGYPSCRQRQVEETMKDDGLAFCCCCYLGCIFQMQKSWAKNATVQPLVIQVGGNRKRSRCWRCYKNMMQGSWSIRLIRLFAKVPFCIFLLFMFLFFSWKHQPRFLEDKNINILLVSCWVLASCWSLAFKTLGLILPTCRLAKSTEASQQLQRQQLELKSEFESQKDRKLASRVTWVTYKMFHMLEMSLFKRWAERT